MNIPNGEHLNDLKKIRSDDSRIQKYPLMGIPSYHPKIISFGGVLFCLDRESCLLIPKFDLFGIKICSSTEGSKS